MNYVHYFQIRYAVVATLTSTDPPPSAIMVEVEGDVYRYAACDLLVASQYRFQVSASSDKGYGSSSTLDLWTEVGQPAAPPRPTVTNVNMTTVTLALQPVVLGTGPVAGYFVVVNRVSDSPSSIGNRKRRALPDPTDVLPLTGYTTAEINIATTLNFKVGDDSTYGGYHNRALIPGARYDMYFVVASSHNSHPDIVRMSYSSLSNMVETNQAEEPTAAPKTEDPEDDKTTYIIIGAVIGGIILIVLLVLLVFCLCKFCRTCVSDTSSEEKIVKKQDTPNATGNWLKYYTSNFYGTPKSNKSNWSDIRDINDSRHVTIKEPAENPDDLQVAEIQNKPPVISFKQEYERLPHGQTHAWKVATKPENAEKNRFEHLLAYDHSRVVLKRKSGFDYLNANYIHGYQRRSNYIATQSPFNNETVEDFWFMAYQEKSTQIVFIARLIEDNVVKCEKYWIEDATVQFGDMIVRHESTEEYASFTVRVFEISKVTATKNARYITQYHFTDWPDHGVPEDSIPFLEFIALVRGESKLEQEVNKSSPGSFPIVVHCGTGVSRTAVFIAVDSLLDQARSENCVNVYKHVNAMRRQRIMMVRTLKQYEFIYDTLFEALITNHNIVGDDLKVNYRLLSNVNPVTEKSYFREQHEILEAYVSALDPKRCKDGHREENASKNRFASMVPPDAYRPRLKSAMGAASVKNIGIADYINGVYVDSYVLKNAFIITQTPLLNTVKDFWQLIYEQEVNTVVMLDSSDMKEDTCAAYWPSRKGEQQYGPYLVDLQATHEEKHATVRHLELRSELQPNAPPRVIRHFQFEAWRMYGKVPWSRYE